MRVSLLTQKFSLITPLLADLHFYSIVFAQVLSVNIWLVYLISLDSVSDYCFLFQKYNINANKGDNYSQRIQKGNVLLNTPHFKWNLGHIYKRFLIVMCCLSFLKHTLNRQCQFKRVAVDADLWYKTSTMQGFWVEFCL